MKDKKSNPTMQTVKALYDVSNNTGKALASLFSLWPDNNVNSSLDKNLPTIDSNLPTIKPSMEFSDNKMAELLKNAMEEEIPSTKKEESLSTNFQKNSTQKISDDSNNKNYLKNKTCTDNKENQFVYIVEPTIPNDLIITITNLLGDINTQEKNKIMQKLEENYTLEKNSQLYLIYYQFKAIFPKIMPDKKLDFLNLLLNNTKSENNKLFEAIDKSNLPNKKLLMPLFECIKELNNKVNISTLLDLDTYDIVTRKEVLKDTPPTRFYN